MKKNRELFALYQGAVMCKVVAMTIEGYQRLAVVRFDNGEQAKVPSSELQMTFDLENE